MTLAHFSVSQQAAGSGHGFGQLTPAQCLMGIAGCPGAKWEQSPHLFQLLDERVRNSGPAIPGTFVHFRDVRGGFV